MSLLRSDLSGREFFCLPSLQESRSEVSDDRHFGDVLRQWAAVVGSEHVLADDATRDFYARSTTGKGTRPSAVVRPGSTEEVREVVKIARSAGVKLHPISCGKNWGYGDACAPTDGQVIVELKRMNRILEVDAQLAYAVIEPGVTQQQLSDYLRENRIPLWMDATGAGPDASVVGNILQRGFGHTPYGDRFAHMCGLEVILADGRVLKTGFGRYENAQAGWVFPAAPGPYIDGLFTQSHLGIVTRMGVWLMPAPEVCEAFALKVNDDGKLEMIVEALRGLRLAGIVRSTVHVANDLRVISARRQYPWELTGGRTPLPNDVRRQLRREAGIGAWNIMGGLYGTRGTVAAARREVRRALGRIAHVHTFGPRLLRLGLAGTHLLGLCGLGSHLAETVQSAASVYDLLIGRPSSEHLKGVFWRSRQASDLATPDPSDSGSMWLSPVLPITGTAAREVMEIVEPIFARYSFEPLVTMTSVTERALVCVMSICFERSCPEESARAMACYEEMRTALAERGYLPYRSHVEQTP